MDLWRYSYLGTKLYVYQGRVGGDTETGNTNKTQLFYTRSPFLLQQFRISPAVQSIAFSHGVKRVTIRKIMTAMPFACFPFV